MPSFPTAIHEEAAWMAAEFLRTQETTQAVLLVNSCARGAALPTSDLDLAVLVPAGTPQAQCAGLESQWKDFYHDQAVFRRLEEMSPFATVHLDFFDGTFSAPVWDDGGGPDVFELEIGNRLIYSQPLCEEAGRYEQLREQWLPFYDDTLRNPRLEMVVKACQLDLRRTLHSAKRGQPIQAFDSLFKAFQEFLQAFFIHARVYPVSYTKWLSEQLRHLPHGPQLLERLLVILELDRLSEHNFRRNVQFADALIAEFLAEPVRGPA